VRSNPRRIGVSDEVKKFWAWCVRVLESGLVVPDVVRLAIDQYQQDNAALHQSWLDQRWMITGSADDKINTADVWDDFDRWAKQKRITEKIGKQKFFKWLQSLDGVSRSENGRVFTGLRLKPAPYSFPF